MITSREEIEAIRERLKRASPGPWAWEYEQLISHGVDKDSDESIVMNAPGINKPGIADSQFIAHARTDIEKLLSHAEFLSQTILDIKSMIQSLRSPIRFKADAKSL